MKRSRVAVGALLSLLPLIGVGATAMRQHRSHGQVYSLAVVGAGLSHDPAAWVNRALLVRGVAVATACLAPGRGVVRDPAVQSARSRSAGCARPAGLVLGAW